MVAEVFSGMIQGIEGQIVQIQADISNGLPNFYMTGYLSNEVKESKERVRTALHNIGIALPPKTHCHRKEYQLILRRQIFVSVGLFLILPLQ